MTARSLGQMLKFERKAKRRFPIIIGVDEAGRGPLAGPVVAGAVALKSTEFHNTISDSKKISFRQREAAFFEIQERAYVGIGVINESVIDDVNILEATYLAMTNAVRDLLARLPEKTENVHLLIDGPRFKSDLPYSYQTIIDGDNLSLSIACASIVAKVTRDRILITYDQVFPEYGFAQHKGYPTSQHKRAIAKHGLAIIHRRSFHCG